MTFLDNLEWRFATKTFDPSKKVSEEDMDKILKAIRFAPTSFGLQPLHVVNVTDPDLRAKIRENGYGQGQITDASHLLVFCVRTDFDQRIEDYMNVMTGGHNEFRNKVKGVEDMIKGTFKGKTELELANWAKRQVYIALGFALAAAAELKIDSCPMEGFTPDKVDEVLGLPSHIKSVAILSVGYRADEPKHPKVRFALDELIEKRP